MFLNVSSSEVSLKSLLINFAASLWIFPKLSVSFSGRGPTQLRHTFKERMDWHEIHILFAVGGTVAKISLKESEGAFGCVGNRRSPFQVYREEDAKVGYVGDLLEDGLLRELKKGGFLFLY